MRKYCTPLTGHKATTMESPATEPVHSLGGVGLAAIYGCSITSQRVLLPTPLTSTIMKCA
jgi:hypothetical protein